MIICFFSFLLFLSSCSTSEPSTVTTGKIDVIQDTQFGAVYTDLSISEFNSLGFEFGDGIDVLFDNGYSLDNIPYYNGYYGRAGKIIACGYPGYEHVALSISQGGSLWDKSGVNENSTMVITMHQKGEFSTVQNALGMEYSTKRTDYDTDAQFANFYAISGGKLKENTFYRSASPCDNTYSRASYASNCAQKVGIQYIVNLANDEDKLKELMEEPDFSEYYASLYNQGHVLAMHLSADYFSESFAQSISNALLTMSDQQGPYLLHCLEGKDRTGFVSALILALTGADTEEIIQDYMTTYDNYYGITEEKDNDKYNAVISVKMNDFLYEFSGIDDGSDLTNANYIEGAKNYLRTGGMNEEQIAKIQSFLIQQ
jgi:hypothetical protein